MSAGRDETLPLTERALNALTDIVLVCDYDEGAGHAIVKWCNDATLEATGLPRAEIIGQPGRELFVDPGEFDRPEMRRAFLEAARREGYFEATKVAADDDPNVTQPRTMRIRAFWRDPNTTEVVIVVERLGDGRR